MYKTLQFICSILSFQEEKEGLRQKVEQIDDWPAVIKCSTYYLMAPAFYWSLRRHDLLDSVPEDIREYFEGMYDLNRMRNKSMENQTVDLCRILNSIGVQPLLLKGMANVFSGVYEGAGLRSIGDIDIVVPETKVNQCVEAMKTANYECDSGHNFAHHAPPLYHEKYESSVEIHHCDIVAIQYRAIIPAQEMWDASKLYETEGAAMRIPSATSRALHNVVHAQMQHGFVHVKYVQQMYDMVVFREVYGDEIDWELIWSRYKNNGHGGAMNTYLSIAEKLFSQPKPLQCPPDTLAVYCKAKLYHASVSNRFLHGIFYLFKYYRTVFTGLVHNPRNREAHAEKLKGKGLLSSIMKRIKVAFTKKPK